MPKAAAAPAKTTKAAGKAEAKAVETVKRKTKKKDSDDDAYVAK